MSHRSSLLRLIRLIPVVLAVAVPPTAAGAAPRPQTLPVPTDAPVVATTPSGAAVIAWVAGGRTCTVYQAPGAPRPTTMYDPNVDPGPASPERPNGICDTTLVLSQFRVATLWQRSSAPASTLVWGVAGPGAARVELRRGSTVQASSSASPAPLPGPAAGLRFWAFERSAVKEPDELAVLDASGAVRRAYAPADLDEDWGRGVSARTTPSGTLVQRGRRGTTAWELRQTVSQTLDPTPLEPERRREVHCLALTIEGSGGPDEPMCDGDALLRMTPLAVTENARCGLGMSFTVLARPPVRSAVIVLGDGRRRKAPLRALGGQSVARGGALLVEPEMAVRQVLGLDADGRVVRSSRVAIPPVHRFACSGSYVSELEALSALYPDTNLGASPHAPHVLDSGAALCLALDRAPDVPEECAPPPSDPESASVDVVRTPDGQYLHGIVPVEVAAARITFADRTTKTVPATPIPGYTGRYASVIAQVTLDVPAPRRARSAVLLDAGGRVLGRTQALAAFGYNIGRETTLRPATSDLPALRMTPVTVTFGERSVQFGCVGFVRVFKPFAFCGLDVFDDTVGYRSVQIDARCQPRRLVVTAVLRRARDRLVVSTRGGREITARNYRLPPVVDKAAGHYVALAVLGPHDAIAGLRVRARAAKRIVASYPAAGAQCGYIDVQM